MGIKIDNFFRINAVIFRNQILSLLSTDLLRKKHALPVVCLNHARKSVSLDTYLLFRIYHTLFDIVGEWRFRELYLINQKCHKPCIIILCK